LSLGAFLKVYTGLSRLVSVGVQRLKQGGNGSTSSIEVGNKHMKSCPGAVFNIPGTSGFYAQMTSLLAGFAFAAIVVLLTPTQNVGRQTLADYRGKHAGKHDSDTRQAETTANDRGLILALLAAFFALVITTLTYSVLAGETLPQARGRAATEELVDGLPFGLAVIMLFHGLTLLMDNAGISATAVWLSRIVAVGVAPVLDLFYLTEGATDTQSARLTGQGSKLICSGASPLPTIGVFLTISLVLVLVFSLTVGRRLKRLQFAMRRVQGIPPIAVVTLSVFSAILSGLLSSRSDDFVMSPLTVNIYLIGASFSLVLVSVILSIGGGRYQADQRS
jgi:hypothetical protein